MSDEEKELSKLEIELVLKFLKDKNAAITITSEEKMEAPLVQLKENKAEVPDDEKISTSSLFPVLVNPESIEVLPQKIILIKNSKRQLENFLDKKVRVQFYFNKIPLFFISQLKECSAGYALVIPESIHRAKENFQKNNFDIEGKLFYTVDGGKVVSLLCYPLANYPLLTPMPFSAIPSQNQIKAKNYLKEFVDEAKSTNTSIGKGLHLIPVARYLSEEINLQLISEMEKNLPLNILYFDQERLVLASRSKTQDLQLENDYEMELSFLLVSNTMLKRKVYLSFAVENIYTSTENSSSCYICKYTKVAEEDRRFLEERKKSK